MVVLSDAEALELLKLFVIGEIVYKKEEWTLMLMVVTVVVVTVVGNNGVVSFKRRFNIYHFDFKH